MDILRNKIVIVAAADPALRDSVAEDLRGFCGQVLSVPGAIEAYELVRERPVDAVVTSARLSSGDPVQLGIGVSTFTEMCGLAPSRVLGSLDYGAGGWEYASVRMLPTGKVEVTVAPLPSWPALLLPQHATEPPARTAHPWFAPAATATEAAKAAATR